jgi:hypothetical protein
LPELSPKDEPVAFNRSALVHPHRTAKATFLSGIDREKYYGLKAETVSDVVPLRCVMNREHLAQLPDFTESGQ